MSTTLHKELVALILQFLNEQGFKESAHILEQESGFYFDMKFFENKVLDGKWEEVESYLSGFTKVKDNRYSTKIYFEIRKHNFLEALDSRDHAKAINILTKDLKVFASDNEELFKELTQLLTVDDIREHHSLSMYGDKRSAREIMMCELKKLIEANPLFHGKLKFPSIKHQRLQRLINQGLNWQHLHCKNPHPSPNISTLFVDHVCQLQGSDLSAQSTEYSALPSQAASVSASTSPACRNSSPPVLIDSPVSPGVLSHSDPIITAATMDCLEDPDFMSEKKPIGILDEVASTITYPGVSHSNIPDYLPTNSLKNNICQCFGQTSLTDFPKTVARTLFEGSSPVSLDFHPVQHSFLLVGTSIGDIGLWDVDSGQKLLCRNFKVWDIGECSMLFKIAFVRDPVVSVNRVTWSPDGSLLGVAYSKHIVQLYSYHGGIETRQHLEIDAHVGGVNDLAFSVPDEQPVVITCGDDKTIKVWNVVTGAKMHTFKGHDAPVYSICPHTKECIHFIFSTSVDGKIKAWLYDNLGARINYDAPGLGCTRMGYSADGRRLFSCGTTKDGESFLVEWDESEGAIKRTYLGLQNNSLAVVQFDTTKNQFLAVGDDHVIKIWDMDKVELFTTINAGGDLPRNPHIRFNKKGTLLAVIGNENRIQILATHESYFIDASRIVSNNLMKLAINPISTVSGVRDADRGVQVNGDQKNLRAVRSEISEEADNKSKVGKQLIFRPSECQSLLLPSHGIANKISRLIYTNAGHAILSLASNGIHLLWKWPKNDLNPSGKATTKVSPQLWQPRSSRLMINPIDSNLEEAVPCFALSKNDSYLLSASGGMISLFNMVTFKTITSIMPPSPAATCLVFYPQDNNIVAIGMDDSTILVYNIRSSEVISKLKGHSKRVTGLAFSSTLNRIVSSGADAQIFVWDVAGWAKQKSRFLQIPEGKMSVAPSDTNIQFHQDQTCFLLVHETHLAIYEAKELKCLKQWASIRNELISQATFSCDSQMVYASFVDGTISIFDASTLKLHSQILPSAYNPLSRAQLPPTASFHLYPHAIAAHPQVPTRFAVGLTDGAVYVLEPQEPGDKWVVQPRVSNQPAPTFEVDKHYGELLKQ